MGYSRGGAKPLVSFVFNRRRLHFATVENDEAMVGTKGTADHKNLYIRVARDLQITRCE